MKTHTHPLEALKYHVTGAIERGEKQAVIGRPTSETRDQSNETRAGQWTITTTDEPSAIVYDPHGNIVCETTTVVGARALISEVNAVTAQRDELLAETKSLADQVRELYDNKRELLTALKDVLNLAQDERKSTAHRLTLIMVQADERIKRCEASHLSNSESNTAQPLNPTKTS